MKQIKPSQSYARKQLGEKIPTERGRSEGSTKKEDPLFLGGGEFFCIWNVAKGDSNMHRDRDPTILLNIKLTLAKISGISFLR